LNFASAAALEVEELDVEGSGVDPGRRGAVNLRFGS
jgi:hypothetical protein